MAVNAFDPLKHHVGLGTNQSALTGFMVSGGYREMLQNAPRITDFGSVNDLVDIQVPSLSRWTMDDFTGGAYFPTWLPSDPNNFGSSTNLVASQLGASLRTVPPLVMWNNEAGTPISNPYVFTSGDYLVSVETGDVTRFKVSDKTRTTYLTGRTFTGAGLESAQLNATVLWLCNNNAGTHKFTRRSFPDFVTSYTDYNLPGTFTSANFQGMELSSIVPIFCFDRRLYTAVLSDTDATQPVYTFLKKIPGNWRASCVYNGLVYILCTDDNFRTWVVTTDGSSVSVLLEIPFNFNGRSMATYAGAVYIGGHGIDYSATSSYAELYEITGASLRLVKTWGPDSRIDGNVVPTTLTSMAVYEGLLWLGSTNTNLIAYDRSSDALYGTSEIPDYANVTANNLTVARDQLFFYGTHASDANSTGWYRMAYTGDTVTDWEGEFISGDFGPEPALPKRWSQLFLLTRYTTSSTYEPTVDYSTDGGVTFVPTTVTHVIEGNFRRSNADLSDAPVSKTIRLRIRFPRAQNVTEFSELVAFTTTFQFLENGKRSWVFTLNQADTIEGVDRTTVIQDVSDYHTLLWGWATSQAQLYLQDLDGDISKVHISSLQQQMPVIAPAYDGTHRESYFSVVLVEV